VSAVSASAVETGRSGGGGSVAQPQATTAASASDASRII